MNMDDIKELKNLKTIGIYSQDIGIELDFEKSAIR